MAEVKEESWGQYLRRHWGDIIPFVAFFGGWIILDFTGYSVLRPFYIGVLILAWGIVRAIHQQKKAMK